MMHIYFLFVIIMKELEVRFDEDTVNFSSK
jgi:hypothetical protein